MPLRFEPEQTEEGFSVKRFLISLLSGLAVLIGCVALGYYVLGPRLDFTPEGKPRLNLSAHKPAQPESPPPVVSSDLPLPSEPQVEVYEKTDSPASEGSYSTEGERMVAPYDYDEFLNRPARRARSRSRREQQAPPVQAPEPTRSEATTPESEPGTSEPSPTPPSPPAQKPGTSSDQPAASPSGSPSQAPTGKEREARDRRLYRVQVGLFEDRENANRATQQLRESGYEAAIIPTQRGSTTLYRVQVYATHDRQKAEKMRDELKAKGFEAYVAKGE